MHLAIDVEDPAVEADVERPAGRETARRRARRMRAPSPASHPTESGKGGSETARSPHSCPASPRSPRSTARSAPRNASSLVPSDRHSAVHPGVKALGNHAITTACRPRKSLSLYTRPSDAGQREVGREIARHAVRTSDGSMRPSATLVRPSAAARAVAASVRKCQAGFTRASTSIRVILMTVPPSVSDLGRNFFLREPTFSNFADRSARRGCRRGHRCMQQILE